MRFGSRGPSARSPRIRHRREKINTVQGLGKVLPIMATRGGSAFFRLQVYKSVRISLVEVYEREGTSVIAGGLWKDLKALTDAFYGCEKEKKTSWFSDLFIFQRRCIYSS